jgi:formylglycine-generating enzyme required for sulfatase activity
VGAYLVSKYEMTQGQWLRVCGANPSAYKIADLHPVENVSWDDCVHCLERLGLRLPTAVEWEYAARAGTNTAWSTGDSPESLRDYANIADQSLLRASNDPTIPDYVSWDDGFPVTAPVGSFLPNGFGLYDVHGNVMEWCFDVADASASNPQRVIRGGAWDGGPSYQTCRWRLGDTPGTKMAKLGLRPVRNIDR